ncbi:Transport and Golgi organization protein 1 [Eumeta japonica]|uniref:Transport and Golgi organization protein 1 n=1 Tax=Eumeta variegata TaxID=151549 RepID=A0A4C1XI50_EUMVA|nr:Transport and Golgi organization protein 1 [Eumeta japonica]
MITYNSADPDLISYKGNAEALVFMKSAGTHAELWFAVINGQSGFVNSKFLRENKIYEKSPSYIVTLSAQDQAPVQPERVQPPHEVLEGTTIYTTEPTTYDSHNALHSSTENTQNDNVDTPVLKYESPQMEAQQIETNISNEESSIHSRAQTDSNNIDELSAEYVSHTTEKQEELKSDSAPDSHTLSIAENVSIPHGDGYASESIAENMGTLHSDGREGSVYIDNINAPSIDAPKLPVREQPLIQVVNDAPDNSLENSQKSTQQSLAINSEEILANPNIKDFSESPVIEELSQTRIDEPLAPNIAIPIESNKQPEESTTVVSVEPNNENPSFAHTQNIFTSSSGSISMKDTPLSENIDFGNVNIDTQNNDNFEKNDSSAEQINNGVTKETIPILNPDINNPKINNGDSLNAGEIDENVSSNLEKNSIYDNGVTENQYIPHSDITINENHQSTNVNEKPDTIPAIPVENVQTHSINENSDSTPFKTLNEDSVNIISNANEAISIGTMSPETPASSEISSPESPISSENPISETIASPPTPALSETSVSTESPILPETPASTESPMLPETPASENYENEPLQKGSFFTDLYSTVADMWTTTTVPSFIEELPTTPETHNTNFDNNNFNPHVQTENGNDEKSFSIYDSFMSAYQIIFGNNEKAKHLFASNGNDCLISEICEDGGKEQNNRLTVFMLTTSISVLLFSLGYYYIDKKRQDGRLVGMINSLQRDLLCSTKECEILKEELTSTKTKLAGIEDNSFGMDDMVQSLKEEIEEMKVQNERLRNSLDDNEKLLRVSENTAGELQNTLGEVENTLSELLSERTHSEEQIAELNGKIQAFEEELISVSRERDSFQLKYVSAESALEEAFKQKKNLEEINTKLQEAENTIELQKHEIAALKDCIKDLKKEGSSNIDVASIIDHTELKAKLTKALGEKSALEEKYSVEHKERSRLQEELHSTQQSLHTTAQQATEAVTRLEVLGKYFQERESELMKELNAKEALWLSKQGESASTVEKIEALQQEVQRYKEKCDSLTLELAELESSKRTAITELEARAHAAWLEARMARRDAAADRDAAATLRRKLASMSTQPEGAPSPQQRIASPLDNSGPDSLGMGVGVIPPPLPPIAFLPPLLPPLPRPPPLGRLPSPHPPRYNDRRYSPESRYSPDTARYSPDSRYSPEPARARPRARYSPDSRYSPRRYSPPSRRHSRERYHEGRSSRQRNGPALDTETEYASDSPGRSPPPRRRYSHASGGPSF